MKHHLLPLWVFVSLNFLLVVGLLLLPEIGTAGTDLAASTNGSSENLWGWSWATGAVKWVFFAGLELGIFFATAKAFLATRY